MIENNFEFYDRIFISVIFLSVISLMVQGYVILTESYGYENKVRYKKRFEKLRKQMEKIIHANGHSTKKD